ncbi:hypothetical protein J4429_03075 [Candidatus Pacearchaeota archaeon]|nr:hypothetical protein [Candidatus Pacearchaeota archaeon]
MLRADEKQRIENWANRIEDCAKGGHPYNFQSLPYNPHSGVVLVSCNNCGAFYERIPSSDDNKPFREVRRLEFVV